MSKKLTELKDWASQNITLINLLPTNTTCEVTSRLIDVLENDVDEKFYLSEEKTKKLTLDYDFKKSSAVPVLAPDRINKRQNGRRFKEDGEPMFTLTSQDRHGIAVREATKKGYVIAEQGDSVNVTYPDSKTRRGRVGKQVAQTIQTGEVNQGVVINPLKGKTHRSWRYEQNIINPIGISRSLKASLGGIQEIIENEKGEKKESVIIDDTQGYDGVRLYKDISPTLRSTRSGLKTIQQLRIRKLTPLECWRLQGFTDEQFYKAKNDGVSNSQLYKQAGNSVTVNVVDAIVKQLF